jgi:protein tyrosine/serine phosphatase
MWITPCKPQAQLGERSNVSSPQAQLGVRSNVSSPQSNRSRAEPSRQKYIVTLFEYTRNVELLRSSEENERHFTMSCACGLLRVIRIELLRSSEENERRFTLSCAGGLVRGIRIEILRSSEENERRFTLSKPQAQLRVIRIERLRRSSPLNPQHYAEIRKRFNLSSFIF